MKRYVLLLQLLAVMALSGCAPLAGQETARTVGASHHELLAGVYQTPHLLLDEPPLYVVRWTYGLTENLDLSLNLENFNLGARAKYAFINSEEGWSLATALGIGQVFALDGGIYYQADIITSYISGPWEPYGTLRYSYVDYKSEWEWRDSSGASYPDRLRLRYGYSQLILGTRYWMSPNWFLSLEGSVLVDSKPIALVGGAVGYRF